MDWFHMSAYATGCFLKSSLQFVLLRKDGEGDVLGTVTIIVSCHCDLHIVQVVKTIAVAQREHKEQAVGQSDAAERFKAIRHSF